MASGWKPTLDRDTLHQLAGFTGFGWTMSVLGFVGTVLGYGNSLVSRIVTDPQSLLYVGAVFFLATLGLDHLAKSASDDPAGEQGSTSEPTVVEPAPDDAASTD